MVEKLLVGHEKKYIRTVLEKFTGRVNFPVGGKYRVYDGCVESVTANCEQAFLVEPNGSGNFEDGRKGAIWRI
mgnify:CR=1 FL=1